jgi:hypothetical protein
MTHRTAPQLDPDHVAAASLHLDPAEELLLVFAATPRGATLVGPGGLVMSVVESPSVRRQIEAGRRGGLPVTTNMVVALTTNRLVTFEAGRHGEAGRLVGSVPLVDVDAIQVKRFGMKLNICVASGGQEVRLEASASSPACDLADQFAHTHRLEPV